jgi:DNA invertase Pin-like site-specific DNA recombinase
MFVHAYLRASTAEQNASRAKADLDGFATERYLRIAAYYVENESGPSLRRPELLRLLLDCHAGYVADRAGRLLVAS